MNRKRILRIWAVAALAALLLAGLAAASLPSRASALISGEQALRGHRYKKEYLHAAITNHRSHRSDFDVRGREVIRIGDGLHCN